MQYDLLQLQDYSVGSGDYAHLIAHSVELLVDEGVHDRIDFRFSFHLLIIHCDAGIDTWGVWVRQGHTMIMEIIS